MSKRIFSNLVEMQEDSCRLFADREIFGVKREDGNFHWITYRQFGQMVKDLRGGFAHLGVDKDDTVAIISKNSIEWAASCYATLGRNARFTSMYESQLIEDWEYIVKDCEAKVLVVSTTEIYKKVEYFVDLIPTLKHIVNIEEDSKSLTSYHELLRLGQEKPITPYYPAPSDLMGLIYTSGTTGRPKGVMLTHGNLLANINVIPQIIDLSAPERTLSFLPWAHIFGQVAEVHVLVYAGLSTAFAEDVTTIINNLAEVRPTILFAVPRIFNRIYDGVQNKMRESGPVIKYLFDQGIKLASKKKHQELTIWEESLLKIVDKVIFSKIRGRFGGRLKFAVSGASALNPKVAEFIDHLKITVLEGYGLSETSPVVSLNTLEHIKIGSVGKPLPNVKVKIDSSCYDGDEEGTGDGEIIVYGPNVMKGYFKQEEESKKVLMEDGGFRTGDIGHIDSEGYLHITGRIKEQYKLENGKYVVPNVVEEQIQLSPYIMQTFVYGSNKPYNVAVCVLDATQVRQYLEQKNIIFRPNEMLDLKETMQLVQDEISNYGKNIKGYERPKKLILSTEEWTAVNGMLTPSLKVKRKSVYEKFKGKIEALY